VSRSMFDASVHLAYFDPTDEAVPNPGMGLLGYAFSDHMHWGWNRQQWVDSEQTDPNRELPRQLLDRMVALPYVDNVYFRVDWNRVQSEPGKLTLPKEWEWMLEAVEAHGKRWSFRVMNSSRHSPGPHSVPDFLADRLDLVEYRNEYRFGPAARYYPAYTDEYRRRWVELVGLLAERFDDHPLLEFVDVSGYGLWGEGHHYAIGRDQSEVHNHHPGNAEETISWLLEEHLGRFSRTPVAMSLHYLDYEAGHRALRNPDVWVRRDSIQPFTSAVEFHAMADRAPGRAVIWETIVPSFGNEFAPMVVADRAAQRFIDFTAHFVAVGFNPWEVVQAHDLRVGLYQQLARQIGYRIRPAIIWRRRRADDSHELLLLLLNDGTADVPGTVTVTARFPSGEQASVDLAAGDPTPGSRRLTVIPMPPSAWACESDSTVELSLEITIRGKRRPAQWAVAQLGNGRDRLRVPLRQPADGDPFLTAVGRWDPTL
jgi:hypothetical protein